jgi:uncharacterized protein (UPF0332 family)
LIKPDRKEAEKYIIKAKKNLELCKFYREKKFDYKIPEEWFYTLYYCALAILSRFGVESRSRRCTAFYDKMMNVCREAISQAEEIVYSDDKFEVPKELFE